MEVIDIESEQFQTIFSDIKENNLSATSFPKLIIGTGLSISMGLPGMAKLSRKLKTEIAKDSNDNLKNCWKKYEDDIDKKGLEEALKDLSPSEEEFINKIRTITAKYVLEEEYSKHISIMSSKSSFEKLLFYFKNTVSVNNRIIDIMTPNYDRLIELICDKLNLSINLGFRGNIYKCFDSNILKMPYNFFSKEEIVVRLFKPHGSVNWIKDNNSDYMTNDYNILKKNTEKIDIVAPGGLKYRDGMTNSFFREHREIFNQIVTNDRDNFSLFIYGYGFNDQHFNSVIETTQKNVLVITKEIKQDILDKALSNKKWTIFYNRVVGDTKVSDNECFLIHKKNSFKLNKILWDLDTFVNIFIS